MARSARVAGPKLFVSLPVGVEQVKVYDWMGNQRQAAAPGGNLQLTLGEEPLYIAGAAAKLWGSEGRKSLGLEQERLSTLPGRRIAIALRGTSTAARPLRGQLVLELDQRLAPAPLMRPLEIAPGQSQQCAFEAHVPADLIPGDYPFRVALREGDEVRAIAGGVVQVLPPVSIARIRPAIEQGERGVSIELRDAAGHGSQGTLELELVSLPHSSRSVPFRIEPGASQRCFIPCGQVATEPFRMYRAKATVTASGGSRFSATAPISFLSAPHMAGPDGSAAGQAPRWRAGIQGGRMPAPSAGAAADAGGAASMRSVRLQGKDRVIRAAADYRESFAAELRYGWDEDALYLKADVTDETFQQQFSDDMIWREDSLQLAFNLDPDAADSATANALDTNRRSRGSEIAVALTPQGPRAFRCVSHNLEQLPLGRLTQEQLPLNIERAQGRITYEIAIPWPTLGAARAPAAGEVIGVAATVNSSESPQQHEPSALGLFGGIHPTKDPRQFGLLLLEAPSPSTTRPRN